MQRSRRRAPLQSPARRAAPRQTQTQSPAAPEAAQAEGPVSETPMLDAAAASGLDSSPPPSGGSGGSGGAGGAGGSGGGDVESWEDGPLMCEEVESNAEMDLISGYVRTVGRLVAPWRSQRTTTELTFDTAPLNARTRQFREAYRTQFHLAPSGDTVRQAFGGGDVVSSIEEIMAFNGAVIELPEWLQIEFGGLQHSYTLTANGGVQVTAVVGGRAIDTTLAYTNNHGMGWTQDASIVYVVMNGESSLSADGADVGGMGGQLIPSGSALPSNPAPRSYFSPDDFAASTANFLEMGAGVSAGPMTGGLTAEAVILEGNGHRVTFDNTASLSDGPGVAERVGVDEDGAADVGIQAAVGAQTGLGTVVGARDASRTQEPEPLVDREAPSPSGGHIQAVATLFFATQSATVGPGQRAALSELVAQMQDVERRFPGALFHATITGTASRRWLGAATEEEALALNTELANLRAANTEEALSASLGSEEVRFTHGVRELSQTDRQAGEVVGESPESNREEERAVYVDVHWQPCDRTERVQGLLM